MLDLRLDVGREPRAQACTDCGGISHTTQGFVYRDSDAFAIYFSTLYAHASGPRAQLAIGIGSWEEGETADVSVFLDINTTADEIEFGFADSTSSGWAGSELLTHPLAADEARRHPRRQDFLAVAETVVRDDPAVAAHLG